MGQPIICKYCGREIQFKRGTVLKRIHCTCGRVGGYTKKWVYEYNKRRVEET
jgi:hypothetical protein